MYRSYNYKIYEMVNQLTLDFGYIGLDYNFGGWHYNFKLNISQILYILWNFTLIFADSSSKPPNNKHSFKFRDK